MQCGTGVIPQCEGITLSLTNTGFQLLTSELVAISSFAIQVLFQSASGDMTFNQMRALNSVRCMVMNLGDNSWNFIAFTYYMLKFLAIPIHMDRIHGLIDTYYPWVCTCKSEIDQVSALLGGNQETAAVMSACSEEAQMQYVYNEGIKELNNVFEQDYRSPQRHLI